MLHRGSLKLYLRLNFPVTVERHWRHIPTSAAEVIQLTCLMHTCTTCHAVILLHGSCAHTCQDIAVADCFVEPDQMGTGTRKAHTWLRTNRVNQACVASCRMLIVAT